MHMHHSLEGDKYNIKKQFLLFVHLHVQSVHRAISGLKRHGLSRFLLTYGRLALFPRGLGFDQNEFGVRQS